MSNCGVKMGGVTFGGGVIQFQGPGGDEVIATGGLSSVTKKTDNFFKGAQKENLNNQSINTPPKVVQKVSAKVTSGVAARTKEATRPLFHIPVEKVQSAGGKGRIQSDVMATTKKHKEDFMRRAGSKGITPALREELYELTEGSPKDVLTGFHIAGDLQEPLKSLLESAKRNGTTALKIDVDIKLTRLNEAEGHSGANPIYKNLVDIVYDELKATRAPIAPFRQGGRLIFLAEIDPEKGEEKEIAKALINAKVRMKGYMSTYAQSHLLDMHSGITSVEKELAGASLPPMLNLEPSATSEAPKINSQSGPEWSASVKRYEKFIETAKKGLPEDVATKLYEESGGGDVDRLTHLGRAVDHIPTIENALSLVRANRENKAFYVEVDIRNLRGLNSNLGRAGANEVFSDLAKTVQNHLNGLGVEVAGFRHGGDEFSFVIVSKKEGVSNEKAEQAIKDALSNAQSEIEKRYEQLKSIEHPKHPNNKAKWGTGITCGVTSIRPNDSVAYILSRADKQVEERKKE